MVRALSAAPFIITDSGSIQKTAPFFGKKALVMRKTSGWKKTIKAGYARYCELTDSDIKWLEEPITEDRTFYLDAGRPSKVIIETLLNA